MLAADDPMTGKPMVDIILDKAGQKGTGKWSVIEAQQLGVPATAIEAAVAARVLSSMKDERVAAEKVFGSIGVTRISGDQATRFSKDLELALFAAKIAAYAQGFAVMAAASREFDWNLPMPTIAKIWRAGCIIRSQFLDEITEAFDNGDAGRQSPDGAGLRRHDARKRMPSLRRVVAQRRRKPACRFRRWLRRSAISTAYRQGRGTANLIQAQRDFFGAHGFERIDGKGAHHGPWGSGANRLVGTADRAGKTRQSTAPGTYSVCRLALPVPSMAPSTARSSSLPARRKSLIDDCRRGRNPRLNTRK